ncbi:MAG: PQQ-binding-like beta-propeller repeat protein [Fuerstiella sp.]|nr:PQQ-binding-like beta-propeller repeat protein [Fuerstiella sp.]MCP4854745.1 PQQ-binding-like beta-propeller repeat protein [Fuerstiella sp.]
MGSKRDNIWRESGIVKRFPDGGPHVLWQTPIAGGFAGPAVAAGRVFVADYVTREDVKVANFDRKEFTGTERVLCLDETSGQILWQHEYAVRYTISYPSGPRCTPNVDGDRVYTLGAEGHFFCFDILTGNVVWQKDLKKEYGAKTPLWGYAAHPLIDGDKLLTLAGGTGSHAVALNKLTGKEIWRTGTSPQQGYSPPTVIQHAGVHQLLLLRPDAVSSVDPETGREYWSVPYKASSGSMIMSPVVAGEYLYVAGFNKQSVMIRMASDKPAAAEVWRGRKNVICPVNVQPFLVDDVLYGFDQKGVMRAIRLPDGERLWETTDVLGRRAVDSATAFLVQHEDRFWLFNELGELIIAKLSPQGFEEIDRAKVIDTSNVAYGRDIIWSMPAFASKHAYIRNDNEIICVDLAETK